MYEAGKYIFGQRRKRRLFAKKKGIYIIDKVKCETKMEGYKIHIHVTYLCSVNQRKGGGW